MTMRDRDEETRLRTPTDTAAFELNQQFMQAHGAPTGELTTFVITLAEGRAFRSHIERRQ